MQTEIKVQFNEKMQTIEQRYVATDYKNGNCIKLNIKLNAWHVHTYAHKRKPINDSYNNSEYGRNMNRKCSETFNFQTVFLAS